MSIHEWVEVSLGRELRNPNGVGFLTENVTAVCSQVVLVQRRDLVVVSPELLIGIPSEDWEIAHWVK